MNTARTVPPELLALSSWEPNFDDRTKPMLLAEAARRDARDWNCEDAENVIAFLLSRLDALAS